MEVHGLRCAMNENMKQFADRIQEKMENERKTVDEAIAEIRRNLSERCDLQTQINDLKAAARAPGADLIERKIENLRVELMQSLGDAHAEQTSEVQAIQRDLSSSFDSRFERIDNLDRVHAQQWAAVNDLSERLTATCNVIDQLHADVRSLKDQHQSQVQASNAGMQRMRLELDKAITEQVQGLQDATLRSTQDIGQTIRQSAHATAEATLEAASGHLKAELLHEIKALRGDLDIERSRVDGQLTSFENMESKYGGLALELEEVWKQFNEQDNDLVKRTTALQQQVQDEKHQFVTKSTIYPRLEALEQRLMRLDLSDSARRAPQLKAAADGSGHAHGAEDPQANTNEQTRGRELKAYGTTLVEKRVESLEAEMRKTYMYMTSFYGELSMQNRIPSSTLEAMQADIQRMMSLAKKAQDAEEEPAPAACLRRSHGSPPPKHEPEVQGALVPPEVRLHPPEIQIPATHEVAVQGAGAPIPEEPHGVEIPVQVAGSTSSSPGPVPRVLLAPPAWGAHAKQQRSASPILPIAEEGAKPSYIGTPAEISPRERSTPVSGKMDVALVPPAAAHLRIQSAGPPADSQNSLMAAVNRQTRSMERTPLKPMKGDLLASSLPPSGSTMSTNLSGQVVPGPTSQPQFLDSQFDHIRAAPQMQHPPVYANAHGMTLPAWRDAPVSSRHSSVCSRELNQSQHVEGNLQRRSMTPMQSPAPLPAAAEAFRHSIGSLRDAAKMLRPATVLGVQAMTPGPQDPHQAYSGQIGHPANARTNLMQ